MIILIPFPPHLWRLLLCSLGGISVFPHRMPPLVHISSLCGFGDERWVSHHGRVQADGEGLTYRLRATIPETDSEVLDTAAAACRDNVAILWISCVLCVCVRVRVRVFFTAWFFLHNCYYTCTLLLPNMFCVWLVVLSFDAVHFFLVHTNKPSGFACYHDAKRKPRSLLSLLSYRRVCFFGYLSCFFLEMLFPVQGWLEAVKAGASVASKRDRQGTDCILSLFGLRSCTLPGVPPTYPCKLCLGARRFVLTVVVGDWVMFQKACLFFYYLWWDRIPRFSVDFGLVCKSGCEEEIMESRKFPGRGGYYNPFSTRHAEAV